MPGATKSSAEATTLLPLSVFLLFMLGPAAAAAAAAAGGGGGDGALPGRRVSLEAEPFPLSAVTLAPGSRLARQRDANTDWLMHLEPDSLTCLYTAAANLTCSTTGIPYKCIAGDAKPKCTPYGHPRYYGHYLGHYLSATAMAFENTQNSSIKARGDQIVKTLAQCQAAHSKNGEDGLLYPYDVGSFHRLYDKAQIVPGGDGGGNCEPICVPFYVMHKVLAGMIDQHTRTGSSLALQVAEKMASWVHGSVEGMIQKWGERKWQGVLDTEWGGMNEALFNLYGLTGNPEHLATGLRFNHWQWTAPLSAGLDDLDGTHGNDGGNHANTHIPEIIGSARGYGALCHSDARARTVIQCMSSCMYVCCMYDVPRLMTWW
eukprot:COSAG01_NODE_1153_length_11487_cov_98.298736_7_plen_374_part_00